MVRKLALIAALAAITAVSAQARMSAATGVISSSDQKVGAKVHTEAITQQYRSTTGSVYYFGNDLDDDGNMDTLLARGMDDGMFTTNEARLITGATFPLLTLESGGPTVDVTLAFYDTLDLPTADNPVVDPINKNYLGGGTFRVTQNPGDFRAYNANFAAPILFPDQDFLVDFICTDPENGEIVNWATAFTLCTGAPSIGTTTDNNGWAGWWDEGDSGIGGTYRGVYPGLPETEGNEWFNSNAFFGDPIRGASYFRLLGGTEAAIPEPGTFALLGTGLLPLLGLRRRK